MFYMIRSLSHDSLSSHASKSKVSNKTLNRYLKNKNKELPSNNKDSSSINNLKKEFFERATLTFKNRQYVQGIAEGQQIDDKVIDEK